MFKDESKASSLALFLSKYDYAYVDTCSLMEDSFPEWMDSLVIAKKSQYLPGSLHIIVIHKCVEELKKHAKDRTDNTRRIAAKRALKILRLVRWKKILEFTKKDRTQNFADNVIYTTVSNLRITKRCLIITQDKGLATDLRALNDLSSQKGRYVDVYKLVPGGSLEINKGEAGFHRSFETRQKNETRKPFLRSKLAKPQQNKEAPKQEVKTKEVLELEKQAMKGDFALSSNLRNPTYPNDKKLADVRNQQKLLIKLGKTDIKLLYPLEKLVHEAAVLDGLVKEEPKKEQPVTVKKPEEAKKEEKKVEPKPTPKKEEKPAVAPQAPAKKLWYEYGPTIEAAVKKVAEHHSIMVRDASIPYVTQIHGARDFTNLDLQEVVSNLSFGKPFYVLKQMKFIVEKTEKGYKAMIDFEIVAETKPTPKNESKLIEKPKKVKKEKPESPKEEKKSEEPKKEPKPKKASKKDEPKKVEEPNKESVKATLMVAIPDDEKKAAEIEKKAKKPAKKKVEAKKEEAKPTEKKEKPSPKVKTEKKTDSKPEPKEPESKEPKKPEPKPVKAKPEQKKVKEAKTEEPKATKKDKPKKESKSPLEEALAAEKVFMANVNNPNYPAKKKAASITKQIELVSKVDPSDRKKLAYSMESLKAMLSIGDKTAE